MSSWMSSSKLLNDKKYRDVDDGDQNEWRNKKDENKRKRVDPDAAISGV